MAGERVPVDPMILAEVGQLLRPVAHSNASRLRIACSAPVAGCLPPTRQCTMPEISRLASPLTRPRAVGRSSRSSR